MPNPFAIVPLPRFESFCVPDTPVPTDEEILAYFHALGFPLEALNVYKNAARPRRPRWRQWQGADAAGKDVVGTFESLSEVWAHWAYVATGALSMAFHTRSVCRRYERSTLAQRHWMRAHLDDWHWDFRMRCPADQTHQGLGPAWVEDMAAFGPVRAFRPRTEDARAESLREIQAFISATEKAALESSVPQSLRTTDLRAQPSRI